MDVDLKTTILPRKVEFYREWLRVIDVGYLNTFIRN